MSQAGKNELIYPVMLPHTLFPGVSSPSIDAPAFLMLTKAGTITKPAIIAAITEHRANLPAHRRNSLKLSLLRSRK